MHVGVDSFIVFFISSPNGMKCRSKPELARILGKNFDLSCFDYRTGRILQSAIRKSKRLKGSSYDYARGITWFCIDFKSSTPVIYGHWILH